MASDETTTIHSSVQEEDFDEYMDDGFNNDNRHLLLQPHHPHNLSRLSVCTSSTTMGGVDYDDEDDVDINDMGMYMSRLSLETFDADAEDGDGDEEEEELISDSENDMGSCYSLPATPGNRPRGVSVCRVVAAVKEYVSDNEAQKKRNMGGFRSRRMRRRRSRRRSVRETWFMERGNNWENHENSSSSCLRVKKKGEAEEGINSGGESDDDQSVGGGSTSGVLVLTRPKGGRRCLCMDLEEVKACRDLGFELEHERMLEMPNRSLSISNSTLDTSSGSNSPIANWRISGPGDDPRDVKARLKVWAQAVALASTSKHGT